MDNFNINRGAYGNYPVAPEADQAFRTSVPQPTYRPTEKAEPAKISDHSMAQLNQLKNSSRADHSMAAIQAKYLLNAEKLTLCAHQTGTNFAKYRSTFSTTKHREGTLVIATTNNAQSMLDISQIAIKWKNGRRSDDIKVNLKSNPAGRRRPAVSHQDETAKTAPDHEHGSASTSHAPRTNLTQASLIQQSLKAPETPTPIPQARSTLSKDSQKAVKAISSSLAPWEKNSAKAAIEAKLHNVPPHEHQVLLQNLSAALSSKPADEKKSAVDKWAQEASFNTVRQAQDTRTQGEKELQDNLATYMNNPAFKQYHDQISALLSPADRLKDLQISASQYSYRSPLYNRVFSGRDTPIALMEKLKDHISRFDITSRHQAILDWNPDIDGSQAAESS